MNGAREDVRALLAARGWPVLGVFIAALAAVGLRTDPYSRAGRNRKVRR